MKYFSDFYGSEDCERLIEFLEQTAELRLRDMKREFYEYFSGDDKDQDSILAFLYFSLKKFISENINSNVPLINGKSLKSLCGSDKKNFIRDITKKLSNTDLYLQLCALFLRTTISLWSLNDE